MASSATPVTAAAVTVLSQVNTGTSTAFAFPMASFFQQSSTGNGVGRSFFVKAGGFFTTSSTAMTQTIALGLDTTAGTLGVTLGATGAFTPIASITSGIWELEWMGTCTASGQSGTIQGFGNLMWGPGNNASTGANQQTFMIGAPQSPLTINTVNPATTYLEMFSHWSLTTGAPTITCSNYLVFGLN